MSKVEGPLFSLEASKTFGKTITFQRRPSGHSAFLRTVPYDPHSPGQYAMRVYMGQARSSWTNLSADYKLAWNDFVFPKRGI